MKSVVNYVRKRTIRVGYCIIGNNTFIMLFVIFTIDNRLLIDEVFEEIDYFKSSVNISSMWVICNYSLFFMWLIDLSISSSVPLSLDSNFYIFLWSFHICSYAILSIFHFEFDICTQSDSLFSFDLLTSSKISFPFPNHGCFYHFPNFFNFFLSFHFSSDLVYSFFV